MDDQFDKKLSSRITEVFDHYEYPTADAGWTELRKKFPVKEERKIAWLWWGSAAAILLVFLGLGIWFTNKPDAVINVATNHVDKPQQQADTIAGTTNKAGGKRVDSMVTPAPFHDSADKVNAVATDPLNQKMHSYDGLGIGSKTPNRGQTDSQPYKSVTGINNATNPATVLGAANKADATDVNTGSTAVIASTTPAIKQPDTAQIVGDKPAAQQMAKVSSPVMVNNATANNTAAMQSAKTLADMFKQDQPQRKKEAVDKKDLKKVNFSVYAATYFNYAEGSANRVNAGAGFTSDIRLSKNIKLSTGVSLAQNTLSYASTPPLEAGRALADAAPAIKTTGYFNTTATVAEFQNYNASLVGLDIPLNIKFEFNPQKTDAYISAGFSSGTFIDERYTYSYAYKTNGLTDKTVPTQDQTTTSSFNNFYFAKTLNLSFGIGYPVGKNRLIVEPFLKYPLAGLGTQDIRFGAGGVNLKFSFKTTKR